MRRTISLLEDRPAIVMTEDTDLDLERAWTARFEPLYVAQWLRPPGFVNDVVDIDLVEGGQWRIVQRDPQGITYATFGQFEVVEPCARVVQTMVLEEFADVTTRLNIDFVATERGTLILTQHDLVEHAVRDAYVAVGLLDRMALGSDSYNALVLQLMNR